MKNITVLIIQYNVETMIFENSEEAKTFFEKFYDKILSFKELLEKNMHLNFIIQPNGTNVSFIWLFKDRETYINFSDELKKTNFFNLTNDLGWKIVKMGSSIL